MVYRDTLVINFVCPACKKQIPFHFDEVYGKEIKCVRCGAVIKEKKEEKKERENDE